MDNSQRYDQNRMNRTDADRNNIDQTDNRRSNQPGISHTDSNTWDAQGRKGYRAYGHMQGPREDGLVWARRVSAVLGADVKNNQDKNIGEIKDLIIDPGNGEVKYAILSFGGFMGMGDKLFAIPINRLQSSPTYENFVLDVSKDQLEKAKGFDDSHWPDWNSQDFQRNADQIFNDQQDQSSQNMNRRNDRMNNSNRKMNNSNDANTIKGQTPADNNADNDNPM
jgi:hypothetical protein